MRGRTSSRGHHPFWLSFPTNALRVVAHILKQNVPEGKPASITYALADELRARRETRPHGSVEKGAQ